MDDPSTDDSAPRDPGARRPDAGSGPGGGPADNAEVVAELERLLLAHGPMPIEALAAALAESRPDLAALPAAQGGDAAPTSTATARTTGATNDVEAITTRVTAIAQQSDAFWRLPDERIAPVLHHLRRATFTHRLTDAELARQAIDLEPDVVALAIGRTATGPGGVALRTAGPEDDPRADEHGSLLGPDGWLADRAAGDLLAIGYDGERVRIDPISADSLRADATAAAVEALRSTFPLLPAQRAAEVHRLVVDTLGLHPEVFAEPVAPLAELVAAAGLRRRGPWVGAADRRWATPAEQARARRLEELLAPADVCCQLAGRRALEAWHRALEAEEEGEGAPAADAKLVADIDHGGIAAALAEVATMGRPLVFVRRLGRWAAELAERTGTDAAALGYLRALGADAGGDAEAAEAALRAGLALEADHPACLGFLAELAGDRGDAAAALALLQRTGRPITAEVLGELEPFLVPRNVGRNDPCPCGSGRKFKACCARGPAPRPLPVRLRWLRTRAMRHAVRNDPLTVQSLRQIFDVSNGGADSFAIVLDMLLFPSRGLRRYLDARGALLPTDELATARTWLDQPMRLLEVDRAGTDATVDATDARTGEQLTIDDPAAAVTLSAGELVLCRPLPAGSTWVLSGTMIRVPPEGRERTLQLLAEEAELRPFHLLHLLVDFQVAALRL